jgi:hypothetical protein
MVTKENHAPRFRVTCTPVHKSGLHSFKSKLAPHLNKPPSGSTIHLGHGVRVTPILHLSNAALDQPHYFVDTSDLTLKDRIQLQRPQASATMTLIQAIPIKKTPLKKMTALKKTSLVPIKTDTCETTRGTNRHPDDQGATPSALISAQKSTRTRRSDIAIIKRFEKARKRNQAKRAKYYMEPRATQAPLLVITPEQPEQPAEPLFMVMKRLKPLKLRPATHSHYRAATPQPGHHKAAAWPSKEARGLFYVRSWI